MKLYLDKRSALQALLNSNGCELAWFNASAAFFFFFFFVTVAKGDRGPLAKAAPALLVLATHAKGDRGPAKSTVA